MMEVFAAASRIFRRRRTRYRISLGSIAVAACTLGWASAPAPDLVLVGGVVYTVDEARPWAEGLAITDGRISAVGSNSEVRALAGPDTRVIELGGAFVTPGFNDGHVHVASTGALLVGVNLLDVHEPGSFTERIAAAAQRMPVGSWITGGSWGAYEQWAQGSAGTGDDAAGGRDRGPFTPHRDLIDEVTEGFGDDWLKFTGYKAWIDGIMGGSSALFFRDYDHDPGNRGALRQIMLPESVEGAAMSMGPDDHYTAFPPGNLERLLDAAVDTGIPPHVHAIGMLGVRIILDMYERVLTAHDRVDSDHRWRVIHAQVVMPEDFARFGALHLVAEVNPYHVADDMRWMEERIGKERSQGAYAFRKLKDAGAVLVFGSDSPGTNAARYYLSPRYGLYAAVTRQTLSGEPPGGWFPDQRLSIEEAIQAYTANPAWACFEEDIKGTLTPGKLADIAVFDTDLVAAGHDDPAALLRAEVLYTIVGGRIVYQR